MKDALLFWCHRGLTMDGKPKGLIMQDHCLPLATLLPSGDEGFADLLYAEDEVESFFGHLAFENVPVPGAGAWVYEVEWDAQYEDEEWAHLWGGKLRRATAEELASLEGNGPMSGWIYL